VKRFSLALVAALSLGGQAQAWEVQHLKAPGPAARFKFDVPGCYPSGSVLGTKGQTITFTRAGTKACAGVGTCQANELCVTADGAVVATGEDLIVSNPLSGSVGPWCVVGTWKPSGAWAFDYRGMWDSGASYTVNWANATLSVAGTQFFAAFDASGGAGRWLNYAPALTDSSAHTFAFERSAASLAVYVDGALASVTAGGTGTWTNALASTIRIGGRFDGLQFGGAVKDFKVCPTTCGRYR
jgi:hypothetical protein